MVNIEIVYVATDQSIFQVSMNLCLGTTVAQALIESGLYEIYPETKDLSVGIYAKQVSRDTVLKEGDRIELYRPLALDPKEKRRQRAVVVGCSKRG